MHGNYHNITWHINHCYVICLNTYVYRYWLKSSVSLVTIMGLTWIIGEPNREFVMYNIDIGILTFEVPALFPLAYIFTIFVAFQGVAIFVIFVPLSKQVREAYSKWWMVKVAESDILSSHFSDLSFRNNSSLVSSHNHVLLTRGPWAATGLFVCL